LLDHAEYLLAAEPAGNARAVGGPEPGGNARAAGGAEAAAAAITEARDIAARLRCRPLLDRAATLAPPDSATLTPWDSSRVAS
jgi:hypothetical protein